MILGDARSVTYLASTVRSGVPLVPTIAPDPIRRSILSLFFLETNLPSSMSYFKNGTDLSATLKSLNGSTTKPFLNLSRPVVGSVITRLSVLDSSNDKDVVSSRFSIRVSSLPISFIV